VRPFQVNGTFQPANPAEKLRRTAVRGAAVSIAGQTAGFVLQMGSVVVLARLLTPADFGIVTMVTTFNLLFRSFGLNGFTELIMQRDEITEDFASNIFWINLAIGAFLTVASAASGKLLTLLFHDPLVEPVAVGMSFTIILACLSYIHLALLQRAMLFRAVAVINFVALAVYVVVSILCALAGLHYWALVWGAVCQYVVLAVVAWAACRWLPSLPKRTSGIPTGLAFALNVYLHFGFSYITRNTDNLIVGNRFGARELGFYKRAYDLFVLPASQLLSPMSAVAVRTLSRLKGDREQFERFFLRGLSILAFIGMGIGADFSLVGNDFIRVLLGPQWDEAGKIFTLFGPGIGVMLLYNTHGWIHLSIGRPERWFRWGLIEFLSTAALFFVMLPWGPPGVAFAWTASFFLLMFPGLWYAGQPINLKTGPMFAVIWRFFAASLAAALSCRWILPRFHGSPSAQNVSGAFLQMVEVSAVFFTSYITAVVILHGGTKPIRDALSLLSDLLPERRNAIVEQNNMDQAAID